MDEDDLPDGISLREYMKNPPPGSALERAIAFGIDPTLTFYNMFALTPEQRLAQAGKMIRAANAMAKMRESRGR